MKINEAMELLDTAKEGFPAGDDVERYYLAMELGLAALRKIVEARRFNIPSSALLLPGETE